MSRIQRTEGRRQRSAVKIFIWFILVIAVGVRLYNIHAPLIDHHAWRQTDTAAIARNFYEEDFNILHPRVDWRGNTTGEIECEFPIYEYLAAVIYKFTGINEVVGRIISIFFFVLTFIVLYFFMKKCFGEHIALVSTLIYSFLPMSIFFTRTFMPESMMIFGTVSTFYFFYEFQNKSGVINFTLAVLTGIIAFGVKIPSLYIGLPLLYLALSRDGVKFIFKPFYWFYALFTLIPTGLWYYQSHTLFSKTGLTFGIWDIGHDKWGNFNIWTSAELYKTILGRMWGPLFTSTGFILFITGIIILFSRKKIKPEKMLLWWLLSLVIYFILVARGHLIHDYYQLPFLPPAAIVMGLAIIEISSSKRSMLIFSACFVSVCVISFFYVNEISKIRVLKYIITACLMLFWIVRSKKSRSITGKIVTVLCVLTLLVESFYHSRGFYNQNQFLINTASVISSRIKSDDVRPIIIYDRGRQPEFFYYSNLKGWPGKMSISAERIELYRRKGAQIVVALFEEPSHNFDWFYNNTQAGKYLPDNYYFVKNDKWCVFDLGRYKYFGVYEYGDTSGISTILALNDNNRFEYRILINRDEIKKIGGVYHERKGELNLIPDTNTTTITSNKYIPVRWGERKYLISSDEIHSFLGAILQGREPRDNANGLFFIRKNDWTKKVYGKPEFNKTPACFK